MKTILFFAILLYSVSSFSQSYTEKYNSLQNRYEYFDKYNNMVAYKTYNSYLGQWEYFTIESPKKSSYIQPINTKDIDRTLQVRQNNFDNNDALVRQKVSDIENLLNYLTFDIKKLTNSAYKDQIMDNYRLFSATLKAADEANLDYSRSSTARQILSYLNPIENKLNIIKTHFDREITETKPVEKRVVYNNDGYLYKTTFDNPMFKLSLYSEPTMNSTVKYKCPLDAEVYVVDNSGKTFCKVVVDGYSGFVIKANLKRQW